MNLEPQPEQNMFHPFQPAKWRKVSPGKRREVTKPSPVPLRKCARIISLFYLQRSFFICSVPFLFAAFLFLFAAFPFFICSVPFLVCSVLFLFAAFLFCLQRFFFCLQRFFYLQCVPCGPPYKRLFTCGIFIDLKKLLTQ